METWKWGIQKRLKNLKFSFHSEFGGRIGAFLLGNYAQGSQNNIRKCVITSVEQGLRDNGTQTNFLGKQNFVTKKYFDKNYV